MKHTLGLLIPLIGLLAACGSENYQELKPAPKPGALADTATMTYSRVATILQQNHCLDCHAASTSSSGGGLELENYTQVKDKQASIVDRITRPTSDGLFMPQGYDPITSDNIIRIQAWIRKGSPQ